MLLSLLSRSNRSRLLLSSSLLLAVVGLTSAAGAATVTAPASSTHGRTVTGSISVNDAIDPGNLVVTLSLDANRGDVRDFLAHIADESLVSGLSVIGEDVKSSRFDADELGKGKKGKGPGTACPCDLAIKFSSKVGTTATFTLSHATQDLTVALLFGQDFAIKATGIKLAYEAGRQGKIRYHGIGSALLEGRVLAPIPEPATAVLMGLGLVGLSYAGSYAGRPQKP